jgi:hypothetical protein
MTSRPASPADPSLDPLVGATLGAVVAALAAFVHSVPV